jgi:hypothetical protein
VSNPTSVYGRSDCSRSLVAALPPLILSLGILLNALIVGAPWYTVPPWRLYLGIAFELLAAAVIAIGGAVALWRRLPDWGYTWLGSALMLLALGIKVLAEERAETGQFLISPAGDIVVTVLVFLAGLAALVAAALRGWAQAGMVSIGLATTLALSLCATATNAPFYRYDLALLAGPLGLLTAALTYLYARRPGLVRLTAIAAIGLAGIGVSWAVSQAWTSWLLSREQSSPLLPFLILLVGSLFAGPCLGLLAQPLRRARGA